MKPCVRASYDRRWCLMHRALFRADDDACTKRRQLDRHNAYTSLRERDNGIGAQDGEMQYRMMGGWLSSAGHVYAEAIREANSARRRAA